MMASCSKRFCWQVLMRVFTLRLLSINEKTSPRGQSSLPSSWSQLQQSLVVGTPPPPALSQLSKPWGRCSFPGKPGNWCRGSTIVQMPSLTKIGTVGGGRGRESVGSVQHFSPLLSSTSYWSPKGSGLEVSSSEVSGSIFVSWIWKSATLRGPSGQTYWNPNKRVCWEGAY